MECVEQEQEEALRNGVLHGQKIAVDVNYQEKMTDLVSILNEMIHHRKDKV